MRFNFASKMAVIHTLFLKPCMSSRMRGSTCKSLLIWGIPTLLNMPRCRYSKFLIICADSPTSCCIAPYSSCGTAGIPASSQSLLRIRSVTCGSLHNKQCASDQAVYAAMCTMLCSVSAHLVLQRRQVDCKQMLYLEMTGGSCSIDATMLLRERERLTTQCCVDTSLA